eukprot:2961699-Pyramimonas_sp.AAC.1
MATPLTRPPLSLKLAGGMCASHPPCWRHWVPWAMMPPSHSVCSWTQISATSFTHSDSRNCSKVGQKPTLKVTSLMTPEGRLIFSRLAS